ncbi:MAG: acyl carrier protein [Prochloraceae cyanobacterium]|nr:acyl carrier protein [Prochloraceae cyanobacterium]
MTQTNERPSQKNVREIQDWIVSWLSEELKIDTQEIDIQEPLVNLGLSSRQAVILTGELEDWLGFEIDPSLAWEYPTIKQLAEYLNEQKT